MNTRFRSFSFYFLFLAVVVGAFAVRAASVKLPGEMWDEAAVVVTGADYLQLLARGDVSARSWELNREHPPLAKYVYGATLAIPKFFPSIAAIDVEYLPGKQFTPARVLSVLLSVLTLIIVVRIGFHVYGRSVALLAGVICATLPHLVAHAQVAGLETLLLLLLSITYLSLLMHRWSLAGVFFGLACATRFNAILLAPLFLFSLYPLARTSGWREAFRVFLLACTSAALVFLLIWPWLWWNPVGNLWESISLSRGTTDPEYFLGNVQHPSWNYYLYYLFATTPPLVLLGGFFALISLPFQKRGRSDMFVILLILLPLLASFFPLKQDGMRYVLHSLIGICLLSAVGWYRAALFVADRVLVVGRITVLLCVWILLMVGGGVSLVGVFPYYLDYYNVLVGGPRAVAEGKRYEIGWWGEGIREAILYVNRIALPHAIVSYALEPLHVAPLLREDLTLSTGPLEGDYVIINTHAAWYSDLEVDPAEYSPIYTVQAGGAPLVVVYKKQ